MALEDKKAGKILLTESAHKTRSFEGAKASYQAVSTTFGPKGKNVKIEKPFGRPLITRDGVTVAREIYFSDRAKNMGAQTLLEASETTNKLAGDGTSATVVLSYHLLKNGIQAIAAGVHPMEIREIYKKDSYKLLDKLNKLAKPAKSNQLEQVATVSSGDSNLGKMIATAIKRVGVDGGIITEKAPIEDIQCEFVDGYYLQSGFQALPTGKKELTDPYVIVSIRRLASASDVIEIMTKVAKLNNLERGQIPKLVFIGNIEDAAYNCIVENLNRGVIDAIIIKTPYIFGEMGKQLLEDIAIYAACTPITDSTNLKSIDSSYVGAVSKVVANKQESTLFADNTTEEIDVRIHAIQDQINNESVDAILEKLKDRVAKLQGKIALFKIGAATDSGKEEIEFRVEDAIHATRAAAQYGVIAGGGVTWLELSKLDISKYYRNALQSTFKKLLTNANLPSELKLNEALYATSGMGYDLKSENPELVDIIKAGILDPKLVVEQVIINSTETIGNELAIGKGIIIEEREI